MITSDIHASVRGRVLLFVFSAAFITYLDRIALATAAPSIAAELNLSNRQLGAVFGIFGLFYGLFEIPAGWWSDRIGQRKTMTRIVGAWSIFTMLTGLAWNYTSLLTTRAAFAAAEAGAFPTLSRAISRWFPRIERSRANGVMWMGARVGGAVSPALAALLIQAFGWRSAFAVFGCTGIVWCIFFWRFYRDHPADHPRVTPAELSLIDSNLADAGPRRHVPWRLLLLNRNMLALAGMYFLAGYGYQFFMTWLPTYLMKEKHLSLGTSGLYSAAPLAVGAVTCLAGGLIADWLVVKTGSVRWARRSVAMAGFALAAIGFACAPLASSAWTAIAALAFAAGANDLTVAVTWATCVDAGGKFGSTAAGFMNTASSAAAILSPITAAQLLETFGSFDALFFVAAVCYAGAGAAWLFIDPETEIPS